MEATLIGLAEKSLLRAAPGADGEPRFAMLEVLREYAWEGLAEDGELPATRRRHAAHFAALAEMAAEAARGPAGAAWLARLTEERENLRAALAWAVEAGAAASGLRLAAALGGFWRARGYVGEERGRVEALLALAGPAAEAVPTATRAGALVTAGILALVEGDPARADDVLHRGAGAPAGDSAIGAAAARTLSQLGILAYERGDLRRAAALHEEALALQRAGGDPAGLADALVNRAFVAAHLGELERATTLGAEGLAMQRALGNAAGVAKALDHLGDVALRAADLDRAAGLYAESLTLRRSLGEPRRVAYSLIHLADAAAAGGDDERAIGSADRGRRQQPRPGRQARPGRRAHRPGRHPRPARRRRAGGGLLDRGAGACSASSATRRASSRRCWPMGPRRPARATLDRAAARLREAAAACRAVADPVLAARCLEALAAVIAADEPARAARLLGAATAARAALGASAPPDRPGRPRGGGGGDTAGARPGDVHGRHRRRGRADAGSGAGRGDGRRCRPPLPPELSAARPAPPDGLTRREVEILGLIAAGRTNA